MPPEASRRYEATVGYLVFVGLVYCGQLAIAGSLRSGAAYGVAVEVPSTAYYLLSPWLHGTHGHVVENLVLFGLFAWWIEPRVGSRRFAVAVTLSGYATTVGPAVLGLGGRGLGASGITNCLAAFCLLERLRVARERSPTDTDDWTRRAASVVTPALAAGIVTKSVGEYVGVLAPTPGVATGSHLVGVVLGFGWFGVRAARD